MDSSCTLDNALLLCKQSFSQSRLKGGITHLVFHLVLSDLMMHHFRVQKQPKPHGTMDLHLLAVGLGAPGISGCGGGGAGAGREEQRGQLPRRRSGMKTLFLAALLASLFVCAQAKGQRPCNAFSLATLVVKRCADLTEIKEDFPRDCCSVLYLVLGQEDCFCAVKVKGFFVASPLNDTDNMNHVMTRCRASGTMFDILQDCDHPTHGLTLPPPIPAPALVPTLPGAPATTATPAPPPNDPPMGIQGRPCLSPSGEANPARTIHVCTSCLPYLLLAIFGWTFAVILLAYVGIRSTRHPRHAEMIENGMDMGLYPLNQKNEGENDQEGILEENGRAEISEDGVAGINEEDAVSCINEEAHINEINEDVAAVISEENVVAEFREEAPSNEINVDDRDVNVQNEERWQCIPNPFLVAALRRWQVTLLVREFLEITHASRETCGLAVDAATPPMH